MVYIKNKQIDFYFSAINKVIFKNKLPKFDKIVRRDSKQTYAYVQSFNDKDRTSILYLNRRYKNLDMCIAILAHQMVHLFQNKILRQRTNCDCHKYSFYLWQKRFQKHGLTLHEFIDEDQDFYVDGIAEYLKQQYFKLL